jgi:hypothetical protein
MKRTIRRGVFETNSSSTHSMTIVDAEDFDAWRRGEVYFDRYEDVFIKAEDVNEDDDNDDLCTYDNYEGDLEYFENSFTTKSGDKVVAFGRYGYDG